MTPDQAAELIHIGHLLARALAVIAGGLVVLVSMAAIVFVTRC